MNHRDIEGAENETGGVRLTLRVQPGASRDELAVRPDGTLKVRIAAQPSGGAANRELIKFLSKLFSVPKSSITLKSGERSRLKSLFIEGVTAEELSRAIREG